VIVAAVRKTRAAVDLLHAAFAVRRARRAVSRTPLGGLVQPGPSDLPADVAPQLDAAEQRVAARWGAAVDRALRWTPGDSACLVRASALRDLVVVRGLPRATVRIGVRRGSDGFAAHAWVEQDGVPIAEPVKLQGGFVSLDGVTLR
jgi:hypothetical protein